MNTTHRHTHTHARILIFDPVFSKEFLPFIKMHHQNHVRSGCETAEIPGSIREVREVYFCICNQSDTVVEHIILGSISLLFSCKSRGTFDQRFLKQCHAKVTPSLAHTSHTKNNIPLMTPSLQRQNPRRTSHS